MNKLKHPFKTTNEVSVWQLTTKLVVLAGVLMAYSYFFLLTVSTIMQ